MAIEIKQQLRLSQQLVMTPQLQQAIKLLQLSRLELVNLVQQELQENPILEEGLETEDLPSATTEVQTETETQEPHVAEANEVAAQREPTDAEKIADLDWQSYIDANPQTSFGERPEDDERRSLESTLTRRPALADHLEWQLQLSSAFSAEERAAAAYIIGNLDDDGYFQSTPEDVAQQSGMPVELIAAALAKVQAFDPAGVAARDLRECLQLQLQLLGIDDPVVRKLVDDHLPGLQKRDFRGIARALGLTIEEVAAAGRVIARLEPRPGRAFGGEDPV